MKTFTRLVFSSSLLAACAAMAAEPIVVDVPRDATPPASTLTRAEVLADLHLWRVAGMQEFDRSALRDQGDRYEKALARYKEMRASPQYAELVQKMRSRPNAIVIGR